MALLDVLTPRFALPRIEAPRAIRRMVRVFFAPSHWAEAESQVEQRFERGDLYGFVEGEGGGEGEQPSNIAWKPYEGTPEILRVDVTSRQFGHHLVDIITMERQVSRKVQPFPHGFRLQRLIPLSEFEGSLAGVLGHPVGLLEHVRFRAKLRFCLELLGGFGLSRDPHGTAKDAPEYHGWLQESLDQADRLRLKGTFDYLWSKRRGKELISQMDLSRGAIAAGLAMLLQEGGGFTTAGAVRLATNMLERFPTQWEWQSGVYAPLRIPIETDWLEVDYTYPFGVRDGLPYVDEQAAVTRAELILHPDLSRPWLVGIFDRQCLILDAVDEIRGSFGLAPDARYQHYRREALQD
ncbi:MAG: hypothetical protein ACOY94_22385 [Bacillota bacterium]